MILQTLTHYFKEEFTDFIQRLYKYFWRNAIFAVASCRKNKLYIRTMRKYPYTILTIILFAALVGPFVLKLKNPGLEAYPAVIFPSGAGLVDAKEDLISSGSIELYGYKNGLTKIDTKKLLGEIPNWYLYAIIDGNFGLEKYVGEFKLYTPPIQFRTENYFSEESVRETKEWLQNQLKKQGFQDSLFLVRRYMVTYNIEEKQMVSRELINERIFKLD